MKKVEKSKKIKKVTSVYFGVILENMNDKLSLVLDGHSALDKKIDGHIKDTSENFKKINTKFDYFAEATTENFKKVNDRLDKVDDKVDSFMEATTENFKSVFEYLVGIDDELKSIHMEIKELKNILHKKADLERLERLEKKVAQLELVAQKQR